MVCLWVGTTTGAAASSSTTVQDEATKVEVVGLTEDLQEEAMVAETITPSHPETMVDIRHPLRTGYLRLLELPHLGMDCHLRPRPLILMVTAAGMVDMAAVTEEEEDTTRATAVAAAVATVPRLQPLGSTTVEVAVEEDTKARGTSSLLRAAMATTVDMAVTGVMIVGMATTTVAIAARTGTSDMADSTGIFDYVGHSITDGSKV